MNQAILFNDDIHYLAEHQCWCFTGILSGARITVYINAPKTILTKQLILDFEALVEEYLEEEEPDEHNNIWLNA
ncbi:hypothetical protein QWY77_09760 [Thalassotalea ponticola]|uniref:hypothetical protein n=1 Tax=Thalassotalea ponticola TaxID=1523392 RepID=UPI0025B614C7|nr:hypothetical protein [Thalassotalea ponticola]MDN3653038.1 hypothetical protein [Thalassotalea ponticola]